MACVGADVDAGGTAAAARRHRRRLEQPHVDVDLAQEEHRAAVAVEGQGVLAAPADAAPRRQLHLEHRRRVGEGAVAKGADALGQRIGEHTQALAQHLVIVAASRIERYRGAGGLGQPIPLDGLPAGRRAGGQVIEPRRDHADRARQQLGRPASLAAVRGQVVHLAVETVVEPGGESRLDRGEVDAGDADLGKSEAAANLSQMGESGSGVEDERLAHWHRRF